MKKFIQYLFFVFGAIFIIASCTHDDETQPIGGTTSTTSTIPNDSTVTDTAQVKPDSTVIVTPSADTLKIDSVKKDTTVIDTFSCDKKNEFLIGGTHSSKTSDTLKKVNSFNAKKITIFNIDKKYLTETNPFQNPDYLRIEIIHENKSFPLKDGVYFVNHKDTDKEGNIRIDNYYHDEHPEPLSGGYLKVDSKDGRKVYSLCNNHSLYGPISFQFTF